MKKQAQQSNFDILTRELVGHIRSEADKRIMRNVKTVELGLALSNNPLRIQTGRQMIRPIILEADEVAVIPGLPIQQGQKVMLFRSVEDVVLAIPLIPGTDLAEAPSFTGTPTGTGTDPNNTVVQSEPSIGGPAGERVIAKALSYVGITESPPGSNGNGGKINEWQDRWGMGLGPW